MEVGQATTPISMNILNNTQVISSYAVRDNSVLLDKNMTNKAATRPESPPATSKKLSTDEVGNYSVSSVHQKIKDANQNRRLSYNYNKELDVVVVSIHDQNTDEVVRTIPTQEFLDMKISLRKYIGNILNIKA